MYNLVKNIGLSENLLQEIIAYAQKNNIEKVVLFGSRARGDFKYNSDIDLAIWGGNGASFALDVNEEAYTLLKFDVVDYRYSVQQELSDSIQQEGIVLYEKI